jgi:hypothetical protein
MEQSRKEWVGEFESRNKRVGKDWERSRKGAGRDYRKERGGSWKAGIREYKVGVKVEEGSENNVKRERNGRELVRSNEGVENELECRGREWQECG